MHQRSLLSPLPDARAGEVTERLLTARGVRMERIVSFGQTTPAGEWYDQQEAEWVMLIAGRARLAIEGENPERELNAGDSIYLPAHCRHRVTWTDPQHPTIWLTLFLDTDLTPTCDAA